LPNGHASVVHPTMKQCDTLVACRRARQHARGFWVGLFGSWRCMRQGSAKQPMLPPHDVSYRVGACVCAHAQEAMERLLGSSPSALEAAAAAGILVRGEAGATHLQLQGGPGAVQQQQHQQLSARERREMEAQQRQVRGGGGGRCTACTVQHVQHPQHPSRALCCSLRAQAPPTHGLLARCTGAGAEQGR